MKNFDPIRLDIRAKSRSQTPAEYADPFERHRRRVTKATIAGYITAAILFVGAIYLLGAR